MTYRTLIPAVLTRSLTAAQQHLAFVRWKQTALWRQSPPRHTNWLLEWRLRAPQAIATYRWCDKAHGAGYTFLTIIGVRKFDVRLGSGSVPRVKEANIVMLMVSTVISKQMSFVKQTILGFRISLCFSPFKGVRVVYTQANRGTCL